MWILLLSLSAAAETGGDSLSLILDGPEGALIDGELPLPYRGEHPVERGRRRYTLRVGAEPEGEEVELSLELLRVRRSGAERRVAQVATTAAAGRDIELTLSHRAGPWSARGQWAAAIDPPPPTEPRSARRYVLVWADAGLADDPRGGAYTPRAELAGRDRAEGALTPFRVVADFSGTILEAEAVSADDTGDHCYFRAIPGVNDWDRQFFLRREDLALVTTREVQLSGPDGSAVTLAAGLALLPEGGGYRVEIDGLSLVATLPDDAVGSSYRPSRHFPPRPSAPPLSAPEGRLGEAAGLTITDGGSHGADGLRGIRDPLVTTRAGCVELIPHLDPDQIGD